MRLLYQLVGGVSEQNKPVGKVQGKLEERKKQAQN